jgi:uncharacterized protein
MLSASPDVHVFRVRDRVFLYLTRSARLYEVDRQVAGVLGPCGNDSGSIHELSIGAETEALAEFANILLEEEALPRLAEAPHTRRPRTPLQKITIYVAQSCNMACAYCWNQGGTLGDARHLMEPKQAEIVARAMERFLTASEALEFTVNFYGGEPLLNFPVIEQIVVSLLDIQERLGKVVYFTLSTNGYLLEGRIARFLAEHFDEIGVSIDGKQAAHDLQRTLLDGSGTWDKVVDNVRLFPQPDLLTLRATLTSRSDSYLVSFQALCSLGVRRIELQYCEPFRFGSGAWSSALCVKSDRQREELLEFVDWYVEALRQYDCLADVPFVANIHLVARALGRGDRYTRSCEAGTGVLAIDSRGTLFPCLAFAGHTAFGVSLDRYLSGQPVFFSLPIDYHVDLQGPCNACWARYDCAGGCYASNYEMTGDLQLPFDSFCDAYRNRLEVTLYLLARLKEAFP